MIRFAALITLVIQYSVAMFITSVHGREPVLVNSFQLTSDEAVCIVPVVFEGEAESHSFVLDSGSNLSMIDLSLRDKLDSPPIKSVSIITASKSLEAELFASPAMRVGKIQLGEGGYSICCDTSFITQSVGRKVSGILGSGFFKERVVQLDFDAARINVFARRGALAEWGEPLSMKIQHNLMWIQARAGDVKNWYLVDTGFDGSLSIDPRLFSQLETRGDVRRVYSRPLAGVLESTARRTGRLMSFRVASFHHQSLVVAEGKKYKVGLEWLSRFVPTIDFSGSTIYLRKSRQHVRMEHVDRSGMALIWVGGKVVVETVEKHSPAAVIGIQEGDVVAAADRTLAIEMTLQRVRQALRQPAGTIVRLTLERDGNPRTVTLRLREPPFEQK